MPLPCLAVFQLKYNCSAKWLKTGRSLLVTVKSFLTFPASLTSSNHQRSLCAFSYHIEETGWGKSEGCAKLFPWLFLPFHKEVVLGYLYAQVDPLFSILLMEVCHHFLTGPEHTALLSQFTLCAVDHHKMPRCHKKRTFLCIFPIICLSSNLLSTLDINTAGISLRLTSRPNPNQIKPVQLIHSLFLWWCA